MIAAPGPQPSEMREITAIERAATISCPTKSDLVEGIVYERKQAYAKVVHMRMPLIILSYLY